MGQQHEVEAGRESEEFLGRLVSGAIGPLGEGESEFEEEWEAEEELEGEHEAHFEEELESLLAQSEEEDESDLAGEYEHEYELAAEFEDEQFFKRLRGLGRFVRRGVRVLRPFAKVAAPLVGTAIGGPLGGLAGSVVGSLLESEAEFEDEAPYRMTAERAQAEALAARAATSESEAEAEALVGAAAATVLSLRDRGSIRAVHADLVRGAAVLAELLHRHRAARAYTGVVPTIVDSAASALARQARRGHLVTRQTAAKVMAAHTAKVLGDPRRSHRALVRHIQGVRQAGQLGTHPGPLRSPVMHGAPIDGHPIGRTRRGSTLQVVTPVRVPATNGNPARLVRVVTNVRVPRGAVAAAKTAVIRQPSAVTRQPSAETY